MTSFLRIIFIVVFVLLLGVGLDWLAGWAAEALKRRQARRFVLKRVGEWYQTQNNLSAYHFARSFVNKPADLEKFACLIEERDRAIANLRDAVEYVHRDGVKL